MTPLVSVIVPTHNSEHWIRQTVESVLCQTLSDFELIIVDDGSLDRTVDVLAVISDPRMRVFRYQSAGVRGPAAGRNRGLSHAAGEYIAFLDHDDLWLPQKLAAQVQALQDHPEAAVAYSWIDIINEHGQLIESPARISINGNVFDALLLGCFLWTGSNPLIRRSALDRVGSFDEQIGGSDDWDMWLRLAEVYSFVCVPQPHVQWRITPTNTSNDASFLRNSALRALERAFARNPGLSRSQRRRAVISLYEGTIARAARGNPSRDNSRVIASLFLDAVKLVPTFPLEMLHKPWVLRAIVKALFVLALPSAVARAIFDLARKTTSCRHRIRKPIRKN